MPSPRVSPRLPVFLQSPVAVSPGVSPRFDETMEGVYDAIRKDQEVSSLDEYSPEFHLQIESDWRHLNNSLTHSTTLFANEARFRFASSDTAGQVDVWPARLSDCPALIQFMTAILWERFARRKQVISINMSPSLIVLDEDNSTHFMYSSRSSHSCLEESAILHDRKSYANFLHNTLPNYDLAAYIDRTLMTLNQKYSGLLLPLSLSLHFSKISSKIYGRENSYLERGLSSSSDSNCIWDVLSTLFDVQRGRVIERHNLFKRGRSNSRIAKRLKISFLKWLSINHRGVSNPICEKGFSEFGFSLLENFLERNIIVYQFEIRSAQKIEENGFVPTTRKTKYFKAEYISNSNHMKTVHLLSDKDHHLRAILNLKGFSAKFICEKCQRCFSKNHRLQLHKCREKRYVQNTLVHWPQPIERTLLEQFGLQSKPRIDNRFALISLREDHDSFHVTILCRSAGGGNCSQFSEKFATMKQLAVYVTEFLPKLAMAILGKRLQENACFLQSFDSLYEKCQKEAETAKFQEDQAVLRLDMLKRIRGEIVRYLSNFHALLHVERVCSMNLLEELNQEIMICLLEKDIRPLLSCVRGRVNSISGVGHPITYRSLAYYSTVFGETDQEAMSMFGTICQVAKELRGAFRVNIWLSPTPVHLGKMILSQSLTAKDISSFYSPPKSLHQELASQSKFGILAAKRMAVHEQTDFKYGVCLDYSKFYSSIIASTSLPAGKPLVWIKSESGRFEMTRNRRHATLANLLFLFLEHVTPTVINCALNGKEKRYSWLYLCIKVPILGVANLAHRIRNLF